MKSRSNLQWKRFSPWWPGIILVFSLVLVPTQEHFSGPIRFAVDGKIIRFLPWTCRKYPTERQSWYVITYAAMTSTVVSSLLTARFTTWGGRCAGNTLSPEWPRCTCPQQERQWVCALCHLWHSAGTTYHWGCFTTSYCAIRATEMSIIRHVPG